MSTLAVTNPALARNTGSALLTVGNLSRLGEDIAAAAGLQAIAHEERRFEDGEFKIRPLADVQGLQVLVLADLHGEAGTSPHDKLCRLLFLVGCLKDNGARRVDVLAPYLCYARKDRRTKPFDPLTVRYVAQMLEAVGTDLVATVDVHNPAAFENAFRIRTRHFETTALFADFVMQAHPGEPLAVVSPDAGGMKRVEALREALEARLGAPVRKGFMEKQRSLGKVTGALFAGDVEGRSAVIVDDLISTGGSMVRTAEECRRRGATRVTCLAAHGLFAGGGATLFGSSAIDRVVVTESVEVSPDVRQAAGGKLQVLSLGPFLSRAVAELLAPASQ